MGPRQLPKSVISFLNQHVDHVVKLNFLLLLHGAPTSTTSIALVARALDVSKNQVRDMAGELESDGLVRVTGERLELVTRSIDDRLAIADLADCYQRDRSGVLDVLRALGRFAS